MLWHFYCYHICYRRYEHRQDMGRWGGILYTHLHIKDKANIENWISTHISMIRVKLCKSKKVKLKWLIEFRMGRKGLAAKIVWIYEDEDTFNVSDQNVSVSDWL